MKIKFNKTSKGEKAKVKFNKMIKDGFEKRQAAEILILHGYRDFFETNIYI